MSMTNTVTTAAYMLLLVQAQGMGGGTPTVEELLEGYERSTAATRENIAFDIEEDQEKLQQTTGLAMMSVVLKRNVMRVGSEVFVALEGGPKDNAGNVSIDSRHRLLVTNADLFAYDRRSEQEGVRSLLMGPNKERLTQRIRLDMGICSYCEGGSWQQGMTLSEVMRQSPSLRLREGTEVIDGQPTYVLEAQFKQDTVALWIDPEYGFNPRKIEMGRSRDGRADSPYSLRHLVVDNIGIEKVDGKYIIMSAAIAYKLEDPEGGPEEMSYHYSIKRANVRFNPDFSRAVKEFWDGVPDGTPVNFTDQRGVRGVAYEWYQGKVRTKVDDRFLQEFQKSIGAAQTDTSIQVTDGTAPPGKEEHGDKLKGAPPGMEGESATSQSHRQGTPLGWVVALLIGLGVVGLGVWVFVKRKGVG